MKKNFKKLAAAGLIAVMSVSLLAGCGGSKEEGGSASSGGKTELTFGIWDEN